MKKRILFVCSSGGHYAEMIKINDSFNEYNCKLLTVSTNKNNNDMPMKYVKIYYTKESRVLNYILGFLQCFFVWISFRPNVIISTGSNIAVMMFIWGKLLGSKLIYIESNARVCTKSNTGKIVEILCDKIIVQWPEMLKVYKNAEYWGILA
ncbi:MAG: capsular biosynthesis protein CpsF [Bacteroidales bacterium]|nr:capsular biosynthesis protein CpsF [Bacteroidales bacterium]